MALGTSSLLPVTPLLLLLLLLGNLVLVSSSPHTQRPAKPNRLKLLDKSSRSVELSWRLPQDGNSPITRYLVQYKEKQDDWEHDSDLMMVPGSQQIAALLDLRPNTIYELRIVARNGIGDSDPSDSIFFVTREEAPSGPPLDFRVEALDQHSLNVSWRPPLKEEWNGDLQGYSIEYQLANRASRPFIYEIVEFESMQRQHLVITRLSVFTEYAVEMSAFNKRGSGPKTERILVYTAEGIPQQPPQDVTCTTLTSQSILVGWSSPSLETVQGIIKGYKVIFGPSHTWLDEESKSKDPINTTSTDVLLTGLQKYTDYSIQVLVFNSGGEGVPSRPIKCHTHQDVPEAPPSVKAVVMSAASILVVWQPPLHPNGIITHYTVYLNEHGKVDAEAEPKQLPGSQLRYEASGLEQGKHYVFWLTASTTVGEGPRSHSAHLKLSDEVPAKIASFGQTIAGIYMEDIQLPCMAVGLPTPDISWTIRGEPLGRNERLRIVPEGTLLIREASRDDAGEYSCHVENPHGHDIVTHILHIQAPPRSPTIALQSSTTSSITLKLEPSGLDDTSPLDGFTIYYKPEFTGWESVQVHSAARTFSLDRLWCGTPYVIYALAYNKFGSGEASEILNTPTQGGTPMAPEVDRFLEVGSSSVTLRLAAWQDGGCPINYFVVEYKEKQQDDWIMVSNQVGYAGNYVIMELTPATCYNLRVGAHNNAGSSVTEFEFATLTRTGSRMVSCDPQVEENQPITPPAIPRSATDATLFIDRFTLQLQGLLWQLQQQNLDDPLLKRLETQLQDILTVLATHDGED